MSTVSPVVEETIAAWEIYLWAYDLSPPVLSSDRFVRDSRVWPPPLIRPGTIEVIVITLVFRRRISSAPMRRLRHNSDLLSRRVISVHPPPPRTRGANIHEALPVELFDYTVTPPVRLDDALIMNQQAE